MAVQSLQTSAFVEVRRTQLLRPGLGPHLVERARLMGMLDRALEVPLTVVVAPSGFGKTTLASSWTEGRKQCAWASIVAADGNLLAFIPKLVAAIQSASSIACDHTLAMLGSGGDLMPDALAAALADELLALPEDLVVVLDDYHAIPPASDVHALLDGLLAYPPPGLHMILTSRSSPGLSLDELRVRGRLHEIGVEDLAFTDEEARAYLTLAVDRELSDSFLDQVVATAEGWATMLHLAALVAARETAVFDESRVLSVARRHAIAYLGVSLIGSLSREHRDVLLRMAVPVRVSIDLAAALTDDLVLTTPVADLLGWIRREGLFLTQLGDDDQWLRFHPVFRAFLLDRLEEELGHAGMLLLHERAAVWFDQHGDVDEAIEHALLAQNGGLAARVIVQHAQGAMAVDRWIEFDRWLRLLPSAVVASNIELLLIQGWLHQIRGRHDFLGQTLADADALLRDITDDGPSIRILRAEAELLRLHANVQGADGEDRDSAILRVHGVLERSGRYAELVAIYEAGMALARSDLRAACAMLDDIVARNMQDTDRFSRLRVLMARTSRALLAASHGDYPRVADLGHQILNDAAVVGSLRMQAQGDVFIGGYHLEQDELDLAEVHLQRAVANPCAGIMIRLHGVLMLARCVALRRPGDEGDRILERQMDQFLEMDVTRFVPLLRAGQLQLALLRNDIAAAVKQLPRLQVQSGPSTKHSLTFESKLIMLTLLAEGRADGEREVEQQLRSIMDSLSPATTHVERMELLLIHAVLDRRRGRDSAAMARIRDAMAMAEQGGYRRAVLDLGPPVIDVLDWCRRHGGHSRLLDTLLSGKSDTGQGSSAPNPAPVISRLATEHLPPLDSIEELTFRELDVLEGLQRRLSNKEIADELSISPLTVKSHTRSIYAKLGVNSRRQAIARAAQVL